MSTWNLNNATQLHIPSFEANSYRKGSGCGSVGRAVPFSSRGPQFESSHRQKFILNIYCQLYWKDENKEKEAGNGPFSGKKPSYRKGAHLLPIESLSTGFICQNLNPLDWRKIWEIFQYLSPAIFFACHPKISLQWPFVYWKSIFFPKSSMYYVA